MSSRLDSRGPSESRWELTQATEESDLGWGPRSILPSESTVVLAQQLPEVPTSARSMGADEEPPLEDSQEEISADDAWSKAKGKHQEWSPMVGCPQKRKHSGVVIDTPQGEKATKSSVASPPPPPKKKSH